MNYGFKDFFYQRKKTKENNNQIEIVKNSFFKYIEDFLSNQIISFGGRDKYFLSLIKEKKIKILNKLNNEKCIFEICIEKYYNKKLNSIKFEFTINNEISVIKTINLKYFNKNNYKHYLTELKLYSNNYLKEIITK